MIKIYNIEFPTTRLETDDGLLISDVAILAEGTWNGVVYTESELSKAVWQGTDILDQHTDDNMDGANTIGYIDNQRFENGAVMGDIHLSNSTEEGAKMIDSILNNEINGISVEHKGVTYEAGSNLISTDITFLSAAIVPKPACNPCRLSKNKEIKMEPKDIDKFVDTVSKLEDTVAEQGETIKKLSEVDVDAVVANEVRKLNKTIDEQKEQITKLENTPVQNTVVEVEGTEPYAGYNYERGTVTRVI